MECPDVPSSRAAAASRPASNQPSRNRLLAALPSAERARLTAAGKQVELVFGEVLYAPGARVRHVYFPSEGFISDIATASDHAMLEVGLIGNEGVCGIAVALGVNISAQRSLVQGAGSALRVGAAAFRRELERSPAATFASAQTAVPREYTIRRSGGRTCLRMDTPSG